MEKKGFKCEKELLGDALIVRIEGEINCTFSCEFSEALSEIWSGMDQKIIILDMEKVSYIDSSGMGALVAEHRRVLNAQRQLRLCNLEANVQKVLRLAFLDRIFNIYPNQEEALKADS